MSIKTINKETGDIGDLMAIMAHTYTKLTNTKTNLPTLYRVGRK